MLHTVRGIVLHSIKFKETSLIVYAYTRDHGRQTYLINSVRGNKPKYHGMLFQPLFLLELEAYKSTRSEMQRVKELRMERPFGSIPFNNGKSAIALFTAEILYKLVREQEPNPTLFDFIYHSVEALDELEKGVANFHLHFLVQLSRHLGFSPYMGNNDITYLDIKTGLYTDMRPQHPLHFDAENTRILRQLQQCPVSNLETITLNHQKRIAFLDNLLNFYAFHFDNLAPIRSLSVLKEVFKG